MTGSPTVFRPEVLDPQDASERRRIAELRSAGTSVRDTIDDQLRELVRTRFPRREQWERADLDRQVEAILGSTPPARYGRWVFYPWSATLVHVLPPSEFLELRSDRNRYKITPAEQRRLAGCTIGVVGLSVGHEAALCMAVEGVGRSFRLADLDGLDLSNLNRIRAGVHDLGLNKAVLAAREMFQIDPYLSISVFTKGVTEHNMEEFLCNPGPLDLLVEECDDLYVKVRLREQARDHGIPVVMDTSDRGMIDVELFDREPTRPILHGLLRGVRAADVAGLSRKDKIPLVVDLLGESTMSERMLASLLEVKESLYTWPQLASGVTLGGALVADTGRRVLLGELTSSGRYYVDPAERIAGEHAWLAEPLSLEQEPTAPTVPDKGQLGATDGQLVEIVELAATAPSAGNGQPWRFRWDRPELVCEIDPTRTWSLLDYRGGASLLSLGAAVENVLVACAARGLEATSRIEERDGTARCHVRMERGSGPTARALEEEELARARYTDRHFGQRRPLGAEQSDALRKTASQAGGELLLLESEEAIEEAADVLALSDRLTFLHPQAHRELMAELRWTRREAETSRDGLEVELLDLSPVDRVGLRVASRPGTMATLKRLGGGGGLGTLSRKWLAGASAVAVLRVPGTGPAAFVRGGRALQRVWLTATELGVGVHPMGGASYLRARFVDGATDAFDADEREELGRMVEAYDRCFAPKSGWSDMLVFRLLHAEPPKRRALRRHPSAFLASASDGGTL